MSTLLLTHAACAGHLAGTGHPESPDRLRAVQQALQGEPFQALQRAEAPRAGKEAIVRVHPEAYIAQLEAAAPSSGVVHLDADTMMTPGSLEAAYRAAGAVVAAVDAVVEGRAKNAFCAVRPPGHHAEPNRPMGFCLFNNIAIGALQARSVHGIERIAVVDFDVHHGNGTEARFRDDRNLVYVSSHQSPLYPGTGDAASRGVGNIFNAPLPPFAGSAEIRRIYTEALLPALDDFRPELVLVSAGFDAHKNDPLANLELVEDDYAWLTRELVALARRHAGSRLVSTLEGGYNLQALAGSVSCHVSELMAA